MTFLVRSSAGTYIPSTYCFTMRRAQKRGVQLKITGAGEQVHSLLKFFDLDALLTLA